MTVEFLFHVVLFFCLSLGRMEIRTGAGGDERGLGLGKDGLTDVEEDGGYALQSDQWFDHGGRFGCWR